VAAPKPPDWPPLPRSIQGLSGPIRVLRPIRLQDGHEGLWQPHSRTISVRSTLPREYAWSVLLHELCHANEHDGGYQLLETKDLSVPDLLASGMMHVIRHLLA
jgi:hypothetical protein